MKVLRILFCAILLLSLPAWAQSPNDAATPEIKTLSLQLQLEEALKKYSPLHPEVYRLQAELEQVQNLQTQNPFPGPFSPKKLTLPNVSPLTSLQTQLSGTFWRNPEWVKMLELTTDQQNKMDDVYQQYRLKLIDLTAALQKEELIMEPLLGKTRPSPDAEAKIMTQIDRIAEARAELEKTNSRMLMSLLQVLTADQWSKLPVLSIAKPGIFSPRKAK
jgi:hypothetical protein